MNRFLKFRKKLAGFAIIALGSLTITGCNNKKEVRLSQAEYEQLMELANSKEETTEAPVEEAAEEVAEPTEEEKEDTFTPGVLDINSNASIENEVEAIYEKNSEWYDSFGIDKNQIRDIIFVVNDKYTDADGNLIIDEDRAQEAFANIKDIMGYTGSPIIQKMDNINTMEYEGDSELGLQVAEENKWKIMSYPSLTQFIDTNIAGGKALFEKVDEYEVELRDYEIEIMNENEKYDRDKINEFVIDREITDFNIGKDNMSKINGNGQKFVIAAIHDAGLQYAAVANPQVIYLEGYRAIDENIKINPTNEERYLEADIIEMTLNGTLDAESLNSAIKEIQDNSVKTDNGFAYTGEQEELLEKYGLTDKQLNLIISYAHYLTTMAVTKWQQVQCDEQAETLDDIATKRKDTSSLINGSKKLMLC